VPTLESPARPRLWLARHGETEWSTLGRHTGRTDIPLTERGEAQARALGALLAGETFVEVLASPRRRALDTCRLAGFGDRCVVDDDLREWDYGADEGRTTPEIQVDRPGWSIWRDGPLDGESLEHVARRADHLVTRVRAGGGDVLCVAHGHLLRVVAARWLGLPPEDGRLFLLEPATVSILGWDRDTAVIERWNQPGAG
jgi:broad specificity phosphatase PhoE